MCIGPEAVCKEFVNSVSFQDGQYSVQLLWKPDHPFLPGNRHRSERRLKALQLDRLKQNKTTMAKHDEVICG